MKEDNHVKWGIYASKSGVQGRLNLNDDATSVIVVIMAIDTPCKSRILLSMGIPWGIGCMKKRPTENKL